MRIQLIYVTIITTKGDDGLNKTITKKFFKAVAAVNGSKIYKKEVSIKGAVFLDAIETAAGKDSYYLLEEKNELKGKIIMVRTQIKEFKSKEEANNYFLKISNGYKRIDKARR